MQVIAIGKAAFGCALYQLTCLIRKNGQAARIMKLTGFLLIAGFLQVSANGITQTVSISVKDVPLLSVLKIIEKQTDFTFLVNHKQLEKARPVSVTANNLPLQQVLDMCFKDQPLTYEIIDKVINIFPKTLKKRNTNFMIPLHQNIDVRGKVVDENGDPVVGASVTVKGTTKGTTTTQNGEFVLTGLNDKDILVITGVNIVTSEISVNGRTELVISMQTKVTTEEEVIVNKGYYSTSTKLNTGSVSKITANEIEKQPVSNALQALEGRIPGVLITQQTGVPGGGISVQIRGRNSIVNSNNPLFVIDGIPYSAELLPNLGYNIIGTGNPLNYINPNDIESIEVLKDADATAIYGSRGSNGVILINTKMGNNNNKSSIDVNLSYGLEQVGRKMKLLNTQQYLQMRKEAFQNDGATPQSWDYDINGIWDTTQYTNWQKLLIGGTANYFDSRISISGSNNHSKYLIGGNYRRETTVFPGDFDDRKANINFSFSNSQINKKLEISIIGNYIIDNNNLLNHDFTYDLLFLPPNSPNPHNSDGTLNWANSTWTLGNPYSFLLRKYKNNTRNLIGNARIRYQILKDLAIVSNFGYNDLQVSEITTRPIASVDPSFGINTASSSFANNDIRTWIIEPQVEYKKGFDNNKFSLLIGSTLQKNVSQGDILDASGFTSDLLIEDIKAAANVKVFSTTNSEYKYKSIYGRLNYNYEDKYIINLTGRRDGSSRFGPNNQYGNFGAIGIAWIFSKEKLFHNQKIITNGKFRGSYGTSGNEPAENYKYLDLYYNTPNPYQGVQALYPNNLFNPNFAWEKTKKIEAAIELSFINRIFLSFSFFRNRSSNQIVQSSLPSITGFTGVTANLPALVQNIGAELSINSTVIKKRNFLWDVAFNVTKNRNELIDFPDISTSAYSKSYIIGEPLSIKKLLHSAGVNPQTGVYEFFDHTGNLTSNPSLSDDKTVFVDLTPKFYGGIQNSFQFNNFQITFFLQFTKQTGPNSLFFLVAPPGAGGINQPTEVLKRWQKQGDNSKWQKFNQDYSLYLPFAYAQNSDYAYSDASYIRLKNVAVYYTLPTKFLKLLHLSNAKIYLLGQNLCTITNYIGMDPETQSLSNLPPLRVITAGLKVTF